MTIINPVTFVNPELDQDVGQRCGEGSHDLCNGIGLHHFLRPDLDEADGGANFICACGCHYVPPYRGRVWAVALAPTGVEADPVP